MKKFFWKMFWNLYAIAYDVLNSFGPYIAMQEEIVSKLGLESGKKHKILIAGCGSGNTELFLSAFLRRAGIEAEITSVDYSQVMLGRARKKFFRNGIDCRVQECDLTQTLTFESNCFDRVVNVNVLHTLPDPGFTFGELSRVLKPEGKMIMVALKKGYYMPYILKANRHSHEPNEKWQTKNILKLVFKTFGFNLFALKFIFVAICNKIIDKNIEGLEPGFFRKMVVKEGLEEAYSGFVYGEQDYMLVFKKPLFQIRIARPDEMKTVFALRRKIFLEEEGLPLDHEDDQYDADAVHFLATENGVPVGVMRLFEVTNKKKFRWAHTMRDEFDFKKSLEISQFGFVKEYRNGKYFLYLLNSALNYAEDNEINYFCGSMRIELLKILQRIRINFCFISEPFDYYQSWEISAFIGPISGNKEIIFEIVKTKNQ
jgi:ubiquinone/menaquinone biosynthesis C-methylase UbiE/N-acyl-L-homoserine lactone synthetase